MLEWKPVAELSTFRYEPFVAEESCGDEVGIYEVPAVDVLVVLGADACEHAATADFEATWKLNKFEECFLELGVHFVFLVDEAIDANKSLEVLAVFGRCVEFEPLNGEAAVRIVSVSGKIRFVNRTFTQSHVEVGIEVETEVTGLGKAGA